MSSLSWPTPRPAKSPPRPAPGAVFGAAAFCTSFFSTATRRVPKFANGLVLAAAAGGGGLAASSFFPPKRPPRDEAAFGGGVFFTGAFFAGAFFGASFSCAAPPPNSPAKGFDTAFGSGSGGCGFGAPKSPPSGGACFLGAATCFFGGAFFGGAFFGLASLPPPPKRSAKGLARGSGVGGGGDALGAPPPKRLPKGEAAGPGPASSRSFASFASFTSTSKSATALPAASPRPESPRLTSSPGLRRALRPTRRPFTNVPLVEPVSEMNSTSPSSRSSACSPDTVSTFSCTSAPPPLRPTDTLFPGFSIARSRTPRV